MKKVLFVFVLLMATLTFAQTIGVTFDRVESGFFRKVVTMINFQMSDGWLNRLQVDPDMEHPKIGTFMVNPQVYQVLLGKKDGEMILKCDLNMNGDFTDDSNKEDRLQVEIPTLLIQTREGEKRYLALEVLLVEEPIITVSDVTRWEGILSLSEDVQYDAMLGKKDPLSEMTLDNIIVGIDSDYTGTFSLTELYEENELIKIDDRYFVISQVNPANHSILLEETTEKKDNPYPIQVNDVVDLKEYINDNKAKIVYVSTSNSTQERSWYEVLTKIKEKHDVNFCFFLTESPCIQCSKKSEGLTEEDNNVYIFSYEDFMKFVEAHHFDLLTILILDENNKVLFTSEPVLNTEGLIWMITYQMPSIESFEGIVEIYTQ
ncbi:MAG TPA: hypothetical protein PLI77_09405 [Bacteroidales bacterium]|nr:hypothetical protein [Bacteroidales bacterium]HRW35635.1 hypothetical protein [Thermotogota bacterium]